MQHTVVFRNSSDGDWVAMYVDGVKVHEGHSIPPDAAIRLLASAAGLAIAVSDVELEVDPYNLEAAFPERLPL